MNKYTDLELNVLSCLLIKPELMEKLRLEDKHFIKQQRLWQFMKSFYSKFKTFDSALMISVCQDKFQIIEYIMWLLELNPTPSNFEKYQERLIEMYEEEQQDKIKIQKIYNLSNELYVRKINLDDFKNELKRIMGDENV